MVQSLFQSNLVLAQKQEACVHLAEEQTENLGLHGWGEDCANTHHHAEEQTPIRQAGGGNTADLKMECQGKCF